MVEHAAQYDGSLAQVTAVLGTHSESKEERRMHHLNKGFCYATILTALPETVKVEVKGTKSNNKGSGKSLRAVLLR